MAHRKLLVADDSVTIQKVIRLALGGNQPSGGDTYEIQTVSDGTTAMQQLSLFRPDIVLIDVNLPHQNAIEIKRATEALGDEFRHVRFVLLSSAFEKLDEDALQAAAFEHRLTKPFDPALLRQVLGAVSASAAISTSHDASPRSSTETIAPPRMDETPSHQISGLPPLPASFQPTAQGEEVRIELNFPPPPPVKSSIVLQGPQGSPAQASSDDEDIKRLTEETLREVGGFGAVNLGSAQSPLDRPSDAFTAEQQDDDFGWSVEERGALTPNLQPETQSPLAAPLRDLPSLPPFSEDVIRDLGGNDFSLHDSPVQSSFAPPPPLPASFAPDPAVSPLSVDQMEEILSRQLESSIQKLAQKLLPELAERIIKEEINRMLREQHL